MDRNGGAVALDSITGEVLPMGMRVLFSSTHSVRHLFPLAAFAKEVRRKGHTTAFLATPGMPALLRADDTEVLELGEDGPVDDTAIRGCGLDQLTDAAHWFAGERVDRFLDAAVISARRWRPDLVVHEMHDLVGSATAAALAVPAATLSTGPAITGPIAELMHSTLLERCERRGIPAPAAVPGYHADGWYLDTCPPSLQVDGWAPAQRLLPLRPGQYRGRRTRRRGASPVGPPRVLVTIGACAVAPGALSRLLEHIAELDVAVVALVGADRTAECQGENITLVTGTPLAELLDGAAAVVTRGCSGSAMAALHNGVPMVMIPDALDHVTQAERIAAAGAGIRLARDADSAAIAAALRKVLSSPSIIGSASRVADEIAALPEAAEVIGEIEAHLG
jgi:UDP:flavonoid glycosyltransferase YjiC (YdhE family)